MHSDHHILEQGIAPVLSRSEVVTPTRLRVGGSLADLAGCSSYSDIHTQAPGNVDSRSLYQPGNLMSETPSGKSHAPGVFQKSSHLPTPHSPGNMASYLLTRTPGSAQNFPPDLDSTALPTEFPSHKSSSPLFRPHSIPTPESSPLVARPRGNGPHSLAQSSRASNHDVDGLHSRASTPLWETSTRPVTPVLQSRPTTPLQRRPAEQSSSTSSRLDNLPSNDSTSSSLLQRVKDDPGGETARIRAQLIENHLASDQAAESCRPDYLKRMRRLAPSSSAGGQDGSLLWSSANVGVIESPVKGKRIALFQETSEESFEESLMAGGYGRYRSDRPWKLDENAEVQNQLGDAMGEEELRPSSVLTEEEKLKKSRMAAFLDPPRVTSSATQLFPVEIEGCGRVLMKVEPSEPQLPPKPTPKAKRSRKRKKASADMKQDIDKDSAAAPEDGAVDGPNWPDTEFPWRSRLVAQDGLSSAEQEGRLRYIESFLGRDSDEDDVEEGCLSPSPRSLDLEVSSRSPRPGRGTTYPLLSHSKDRRRGTTTLSVISSDPADARAALLSKKSIRAVRLRLLRRGADNDDDEVLCVCRGRDDGRPLVQCDACRTWYHLQCIGIQSTSELGREEDPWFCANCAEVKTPPPVVIPMSEPMFVPTDDDEHGVGGHGSADVERHDAPFLDARLNPSPATPWTRSLRPPTTPPRTQYAPHTASGSSWDEPPSSSSRGDPRTPQFNTASAFGDMVRVYGMTPGRSLEGSSSTVIDESPFDPTSTPSRGIRFGQPFATPKDGRWGSFLWQGVRGSASGHELFRTPNHPGEDGGAAPSRSAQPLLYHGQVGDVSAAGPSGAPGSNRVNGLNNVTPVERDVLSGLKQMQVLESPLGRKRPRRTVDS
ncbi:hypothetical protein JVT61DRAFT_6686 [Boletus reticuloceps]|uniref:PHD-type domain-containing protein n=1 Tax=Boletus reticuloceps TaxID=495285 RepID=A0A8I2YKA2_9AGAM|nr:hypothetical protein JVT61DRAFT_6686 [Boletus reticuloceps]